MFRLKPFPQRERTSPRKFSEVFEWKVSVGSTVETVFDAIAFLNLKAGHYVHSIECGRDIFMIHSEHVPGMAAAIEERAVMS
jgi:hypothetical protein